MASAASFRSVARVAVAAALVTACLHAAILEVRLHVLGRLSSSWTDFVWMAPIAYTGYFLALAMPLALVRWWRPGTMSVARLTGIYGGIAAFSILLLYKRIHPLAFAIIAIAVGVQIARLARRQPMAVRAATRVAAAASTVLLATLIAARMLWPRLAENRALAAERTATADAPNILLLILDTVRAASLSAYGYHRPTTPVLEALATEGVLFEHAFAPESWTLPSHASMLTGLWAEQTGTSYLTPLPRGVATLPGTLRGAGYVTGGIVANSGWASIETGIGRDFQHYETYHVRPAHLLWSTSFSQMRLAQELISAAVTQDFGRAWSALRRFELRPLDPRRPGQLDAADVAQRFSSWRATIGDRHPWFAMLNFFDAHGPYESPFRERFGQGTTELDRYDGAIAYVDSLVGEVLGQLRRRGELDRTIVIVTADHGELFGEHGHHGHGTTLYRPVVEVPLVVRYPARLGASVRRSDAVSLRDLAATVLDLAGATNAARLPGTSWFDSARGESTSPLFLRAVRGINAPEAWPNAHGDITGVVTDEWYYIRYVTGAEELFAWREDPAERVNHASQPSAQGVLERLRRAVPP